MWFYLLVAVFSVLAVVNLLLPQAVFDQIEMRRTLTLGATTQREGNGSGEQTGAEQKESPTDGWGQWIRRFSIQELRALFGMFAALGVVVVSLIVLCTKDAAAAEWAKTSLPASLGFLFGGATSARK